MWCQVDNFYVFQWIFTFLIHFKTFLPFTNSSLVDSFSWKKQGRIFVHVENFNFLSHNMQIIIFSWCNTRMTKDKKIKGHKRCKQIGEVYCWSEFFILHFCCSYPTLFTWTSYQLLVVFKSKNNKRNYIQYAVQNI